MGNSQGAVYLTTHLKERFLQRTNKKYRHLQNCRLGENKCEECKNLMNDIRLEIDKRGIEVEKEIKQVVNESEEERSYLNNPGFMDWYYQKYGFDKRFRFLVEPKLNLLFIVVVERGREVVVTCLKAKSHLVGKAVVSRNKFRKKPT
jgi:hypothetical protein